MAEASSTVATRDLTTDGLHEAILKALLYADIFDYPLLPEEIVRYLNVPAHLEVVQAALDAGARSGSFAQSAGFYSLPQRPDLVATRARRAELARRVWLRARRYARLMASLPFIEMVAVTGALSVDNVEPDGDMDFLLVCAPGQVWLVRALTGIMRRMARAAGDRICPNYILASNALELDQRSLYAARELFQMVPLYGLDVYRRLLASNPWALRFLPNGTPLPPNNNGHSPVNGLIWPLRRSLEISLGGALGRKLQEAEWQRWQRMAARHEHVGPEVVLTPDRFKMHDLGHGGRILAVYAERLASYGLSLEIGDWRLEIEHPQSPNGAGQ
jgi:hypothetical protein